MSLITINSRGIDFNVKIVRNGENYGLNNVLTHDKDDPLVEFMTLVILTQNMVNLFHVIMHLLY